MSIPRALLTSEKQSWETPDLLFKYLDGYFNFQVDLAADDVNHKCPVYYSESNNAFNHRWDNGDYWSFWCNPPYGDSRHPVGAWIERAFYSFKHNMDISFVFLLPTNKCDQDWFHRFVIGTARVVFLRGRVKFKGSTTGNTQGSMIIIYNGDCSPGIASLNWKTLNKTGSVLREPFGFNNA